MRSKDDKITEITKDVSWIGVLDYDIRTFDIVMTTEHGTTYNSYFINAGKKAIVELAKAKFCDVFLEKLRKLTDLSEIQYIIVDHTEPDHVGSLKVLLDLIPDVTVVGSGNAIRYLEDILNKPFRSLVVKHGDKLDLGNKTLTFIAAPNLHWPDTIYTYLEEDKVLFTCDSFGAHYCSENLFSNFDKDYTESFKYYFDVILRPFSRFMLKAIDFIKPMQIDYICTGHGPVHRGKSIATAIELSSVWAREYMARTTDKNGYNIFVAYISAYGYTKEAASIIARGIEETQDIKCEVADIEEMPLDILEEKLTNCDGLIVGSPTINQNTLLPVYKLFALVNPIRDKGKLAGSFGSYGWSGEAPRIILDTFRSLKFKTFEEPGGVKFSPEGSKEDFLLEYGRKYAVTFMNECGRK
ncbi:MAG TPA: FprA family A-type flavoprotein [Bacteroidales bacterium]|nr:FprA family A-type flavoprotein [Bacteroidales bacterium]